MTIGIMPVGTFSTSGANNFFDPKMNQTLIHPCLFLDTLEAVFTIIRKLVFNPSTWLAFEDQQWSEFATISTKCGGQSCMFCITVTYTHCNSLCSLVFESFFTFGVKNSRLVTAEFVSWMIIVLIDNWTNSEHEVK